jgi:chromosome segregation ATPase
MLDDQKELHEQVSAQEESHQNALSLIATLNGDTRNLTQSISDKDCSITQIESDMRKFSQANLEDEQINNDIINERLQLEYKLKPYEDDVRDKEADLSALNEQIKSNSNTLSHLRVDLDSGKIKVKQAKQQLASLVRECSEKEGVLASLESKLFIGNDSALNCIGDYHALKTRLRSISEEFLGDKERKHLMTRSDDKRLNSITDKTNALKLIVEQKRKTHAKDMNRLNREYAVLVKVRKFSSCDTVIHCTEYLLTC